MKLFWPWFGTCSTSWFIYNAEYQLSIEWEIFSVRHNMYKVYQQSNQQQAHTVNYVELLTKCAQPYVVYILGKSIQFFEFYIGVAGQKDYNNKCNIYNPINIFVAHIMKHTFCFGWITPSVRIKCWRCIRNTVHFRVCKCSNCVRYAKMRGMMYTYVCCAYAKHQKVCILCVNWEWNMN